MPSIQDISEDGFSHLDDEGRSVSVAFLSLRTALMAYFSTYQSMKFALHLFDTNRSQDQRDIDFNHSFEYRNACVESLIHFQHFTELILKEFLRMEHPALVLNTQGKHITLHKLLNNEEIPSDEYDSIRTIMFNDTLERLCSLIRNDRISHHDLNFILDAKKWMDALNMLRNRMLHRGTFVLRYPALDCLVGMYILPFVKRITELQTYNQLSKYWKYERLDCAIDPLEQIIAEFQTGHDNIGKVAFLKELGRAAYTNPLQTDSAWTSLFNDEVRRRAKHAATAELSESNRSTIQKCPVCGIDSLIVYDDIDVKGEDHSTGSYERAWRYTWQVKCVCCSFEVNNHLDNPSVYGLPIGDYWRSEEL